MKVDNFTLNNSSELDTMIHHLVSDKSSILVSGVFVEGTSEIRCHELDIIPAALIHS
jgi:hypothetical protein